ncbi:hypothetical protein T01_1907 [Trichinella spiralis]|uniref:Uncharacterized protein n=1 Tax=Trichinella spiralis TaxID=6334 RepID=A0A0V1AZD1_TRISP|nr:hypothetical protein T01_1907 [Trichinella spiralis]
MFSIMLEQEVKYDKLKCDKRPKTEGDQAGKNEEKKEEFGYWKLGIHISVFFSPLVGQYLNNFPKQQHAFLAYCSSFVISFSFTGKYLLVKSERKMSGNST